MGEVKLAAGSDLDHSVVRVETLAVPMVVSVVTPLRAALKWNWGQSAPPAAQPSESLPWQPLPADAADYPCWLARSAPAAARSSPACAWPYSESSSPASIRDSSLTLPASSSREMPLLTTEPSLAFSTTRWVSANAAT